MPLVQSHPSSGATERQTVLADLLHSAIWSGCLTGFLEGVCFLVRQRFWEITHVSLEIVWVAALCNMFLFSALGIACFLVLRCWPRLAQTSFPTFVFAFFMFVDWLLVLAQGYLSRLSIAALAVGVAIQSSRWISQHTAMCTHIKRVTLPWLLGLLLLSFVGITGGQWLHERLAVRALPMLPAGTPNVLLIIIDTLRADHLSSYGYQRLTSPFIDSLGQQGIVFEQAFSTSSYTLPSHASLLTGLYPHEHGVEWHTPRALFSSPWPTLAEVLRDRGYRTGAFTANVFYFTRAFGFTRGFLRFEDYFHSVTDAVFRTLYGRVIERLLLHRLGFADYAGRKSAADVTQATQRWLNRDPQRPFFVCINYIDTHDPYLPPQPHRSKFSSLPAPGGLINYHVRNTLPSLTPAQLQSEIDAYDGAIAYVDEHIASLLTSLQQTDWGKNTLVVITSDHGEAFNEHGLLVHDNALYREVIHVPLLFWWPGQVPAGLRVTQPVSNASVPATILHLLGIDRQGHFPSPALAPLWENHTNPPPWPVPLAAMAQKPWMPKTIPIAHGAMQSLITPQWHYIVHATRLAELYDWQQDPHTLHNVADHPQTRDIVAQLHAQLLSILSSGNTPRQSTP